MATSFDTIEDLGLITVDDYKFAKIYNQTEDGFKKYCDGFLISAIPNFFQCRQDLSYVLENREFVSDLSTSEIGILSNLWIIEWFSREVQNSTQFQNKLQTTQSFKNHAESQNLKEKSAYLDKLREEVDRKITKYQLEDLENMFDYE